MPLTFPSYHPSWGEFFTDDIKQLLIGILDEVSSDADVTPGAESMLRFLSLNLNEVKVLILGQDPYPQRGVATGRAFEVGGLTSWLQPFSNTSLRNIVRCLYAAYNDEVLTFGEVRAELNGKFPIIPPHKLFAYWESRGVLLLNSSFSCRVGQPGSHARLWRPFTNRLLSFINRNQPEAVWLLWGGHSKEIAGSLDIQNAYTSAHPMICYHRPDDFLFGVVNHFKATAHLVDWLGVKAGDDVQ